MQKFLAFVTFSFILISCSRKTVPASSNTSTNTNTTATVNTATSSAITDSTISTNPVKKETVYNPPIKTPAPKAITVNDKAATRTADGRYYYDLEGKRYWRNKKDGKYYLYYKGMFENKNFQ